MQVIRFILVCVLAAALQQCSYSQSNNTKNNPEKMDSTENKQGVAKEGNPVYSTTDSSKVNLSESEWKKILPEEVYYIARQKGTERPYTSKYEKAFGDPGEAVHNQLIRNP